VEVTFWESVVVDIHSLVLLGGIGESSGELRENSFAL
jgi:hypothetical protein